MSNLMSFLREIIFYLKEIFLITLAYLIQVITEFFQWMPNQFLFLGNLFELNWSVWIVWGFFIAVCTLPILLTLIVFSQQRKAEEQIRKAEEQIRKNDELKKQQNELKKQQELMTKQKENYKIVIDLIYKLGRKDFISLSKNDYREILERNSDDWLGTLSSVSKIIAGFLVPNEEIANVFMFSDENQTNKQLASSVKSKFLKVFSFEFEEQKRPRLYEILDNLKKEFDLVSIKYGLWSGLDVFACLICDDVSGDDIQAKAQKFSTMVRSIISAGCDVHPTFLGFQVGRNQNFGGRGSLCLVFKNQQAFKQLESSIFKIHLISDSTWRSGWNNMLKSPIFSRRELPIYFEKIIYCKFNNSLKSSINNRGWYQFGFPLNALKDSGNLAITS